jgi:hypothetical protein
MEEERGNDEMNKTKKLHVKEAVLKKEKCSRNAYRESRHTNRRCASWAKKKIGTCKLRRKTMGTS